MQKIDDFKNKTMYNSSTTKLTRSSSNHLHMNYTTFYSAWQQLNPAFLSENENSICFYVETKASVQTCPRCGGETSLIHSYRKQKVKVLMLHGKEVFINLRKRRYICSCGKTFFEKYDFLPKYRRTSNAFRFDILNELKSKSSIKQIAERYRISPPTVQRIIDSVTPSKPKELPPILGIDEFKGNSGGEKYNCILTDITNGKIFDILPTRNKSYISEYLRGFKNRKEVKFFAMDMTNNYKALSYLLPNAKVAIDKFHYTRQVYLALENVRKRIQKEMRPWKRKYFKRSRYLLLKDYSKLKEEEKQAAIVMLSQSEELRTAWSLKEMFVSIKENRSGKGARELINWINTAKESKIEEFKGATTAFENWYNYIVCGMENGITNAFTEGKNNNIKVLKRNAYGFRNFSNFRARILLSC